MHTYYKTKTFWESTQIYGDVLKLEKYKNVYKLQVDEVPHERQMEMLVKVLKMSKNVA